MTKKNQNKENTSINSVMPETMYSEGTAQKARYALDDVISDLHYAVLDLRNAGLPIETVKDLKEIKRKSVKTQLEKDREAYFKNMHFVPAGLRRQVNKEFDDLEKTLLPLVDQLAKARERVPLSYSLNIKDNYATGEYCIVCNKKEIDDYVRKTATITILPEHREYYNAISSFCNSWAKLQKEAERLHIVKPDKRLINDLMEESSGNDILIPYEMYITPEKMFRMIYNNDVIRMQTAEERELSSNGKDE